MDATAPELFFLPMAGRGQRLAVHHRPARGRARRAVLYVHPFAEEMNKSRRMAALQAREFARAGFAVLQIDLLGCGDSSGDFGDASWPDWVQDVVDAAAWLRACHDDAPLTIWGLRAGCLLATDAARQLGASVELLYWQPTPSGSAVLQQFLRLAVAADLAAGGAAGTATRLRDRLGGGEPIDVAGYRLTPALARGLERAELEPAPPAARVLWLETSARGDATLPPASAARIERWRQQGRRVDARAVTGPAFWQTAEIEEAPALLDATSRLSRDRPAVPA